MTSAEKRQRHKTGHRSRVEEARIAQAKARRRNRVVRALIGVLVLGVVVGAVAILTRDDDGDERADDDTTTTATTEAEDPTATTEAAVPVELPPGPEGRTLEGETPCPAPDGEERVAVFAQAPPTCIAEGEALTATIGIDLVDAEGTATDIGAVVVELDAEAAPTMVNNFVVLSRYGFYDGIPFHRLVPDFVAQVGGSGAPGPDGAPDYGSTGPGYDMEDVEHPEGGYAVGDVAMARAENVSGSQFFVVTAESALQALDQAGNYPRFGRVTEGLELAAAMADSGDAATNGTPTTLYVIRDVTITAA